MRKSSLLLIALLLSFSACIEKRVTYVTRIDSHIENYTPNNYKFIPKNNLPMRYHKTSQLEKTPESIMMVAKELASSLSIPIKNGTISQEERDNLDEITLIALPNAINLTLNGQIFEPNKSKPNDNVVPLIEEISENLKKYPQLIIQVTGHTDKEESGVHQDLSNDRALNIAEMFYTLELPHEIFAKGCADEKPLFSKKADNKTLSNARVEIYLYADKEQMKDYCH